MHVRLKCMASSLPFVVSVGCAVSVGLLATAWPDVNSHSHIGWYKVGWLRFALMAGVGHFAFYKRFPPAVLHTIAEPGAYFTRTRVRVPQKAA